MTGEILRQSVTITNAHGFHMRPQAAFAETANKYPCAVSLMRAGDEPVNGKSLLGLLGLSVPPGTELVIEVSGPQAAEALRALVQVFHLNFDEEQEPSR